MSKTIRSLFILASLACLPLLAAQKVKVDKLAVKTLPAQVYSQLQKGKDLSLIWRGPDFNPSRSFKIGKVDWEAHERIGEAISYLNTQVPLFAPKTPGYYTLDLAVTDAQVGKTFTVFWKDGFIVLEGVVKDPDGKVVAAFVNKEKALEYTLDSCVDKALGGIKDELFK